MTMSVSISTMKSSMLAVSIPRGSANPRSGIRGAMGKWSASDSRPEKETGPISSSPTAACAELLGGYLNAIDPPHSLDDVEFIIDNATVSVIGVTEGSNDGANGYHPHVIRETLRGVTRDMPHPGRGGRMPVRYQGGKEQFNLPMYRSGMDPLRI